MEIKDVIKERRSIRSYKNKEVSSDLIEDILYNGTMAPSAKNKQPWYFVVLEKEFKDKVANLMIDYINQEKESEEKIKYGYNSSVKATAMVIKQAPILVLIFREKDNNWIVGDNLSIGACVENMCLRATDLGLGTLWIRDTVYVSQEITEIYGQEDMELNCALAIGYQDEFPKSRTRKKVKNITEWYK